MIISSTGFLNPLLELEYEGNIYPIHSKASEVSGLKAYPSVLDVPGPVDYVVCAIAARYTPQLVRECVAKGVKVMALFTAGFSFPLILVFLRRVGM